MSENTCQVTPGLRAFSNRLLYEVAEKHGVNIVELATAPVHKSAPVVAARVEFILRMDAEVVYRDPSAKMRVGGADRYREYRLRSELPTSPDDRVQWRKVSTVDIARCIMANHSTIVLVLQKARRTGEVPTNGDGG